MVEKGGKLNKIIAICGPIGAGKGTVTKYLQEWYKAHVLNAPQLLKELCQVLNLPATRKNFQDMGVAIGSNFGGDRFLIPLLDRLPRPWPELIVYDGIRYTAQHNYLVSRPDIKYTLIAVDAPADARFERTVRRRQYRDEAAITREEFEEIARHAIEQDIPALMELAHYQLDNSGSEGELIGQLGPIIDQIT
jgi:dephospho-CoA kinase